MPLDFYCSAMSPELVGCGKVGDNRPVNVPLCGEHVAQVRDAVVAAGDGLPGTVVLRPPLEFSCASLVRDGIYRCERVGHRRVAGVPLCDEHAALMRDALGAAKARRR